MDISNAFKTEVFRPIVITLIPGAFSLAPYVYILYLTYPTFSELVKYNLAGTAIVYVFISIAAGMVLENIGSGIEIWFGSIVAKRDKKYDDDWDKYLRTNFEKPPIGLDYISSIVMRMKFELSFSISLVFVLIGVWLIHIIQSRFGSIECFVLTVVVILLAAYLGFEAFSGVKLLGKLRRNLLNGVNAI